MHFQISFIRLIFVLFFPFLVSVSALTSATDYQTYSSELVTSVDLDIGHIDNFLFSDGEIEGTQFLSVKPQLAFITTWDKTLIGIEAKANLSKFSAFDEDDNSSYQIGGELAHFFTYNQKLTLNINHAEQYEYRGTGASLGLGNLIDSGNERLVSHYLINYRYGQDHSIARFNLFAGQSNQEYKTRRQFTDIYDLASDNLGGMFDFFISNNFYASAELKYQNDHYRNNPVLDSSHYQLLIGGKWQTSEASAFELLIGQQQISFDNKLLENSEDFSWRLLFKWKPYDFFTAKIDSSSHYEQSYQGSDQYLVVEHINVELGYEINQRLGIASSLCLKNNEIVGQAYKRDDDFSNFALSSKYQWSENTSFKAQYKFNNLTSSLQGLNYQRNELTIQVKVLI